MTKSTLEKMPDSVLWRLEEIRKNYKNPSMKRENVREMLYGYTLALRDAGIITERERQILYIYGTV